MGIATDSNYDNDAVIESKYVSGIHVESVYCNDNGICEEFAEKYELDKSETDYNSFLGGVDIVYVKTKRELRYTLIKQALLNGKHVISDPAITLDESKLKELFDIAQQNNVILLENTPTLYLQAFNQLLWNARGNLIGDLVSIKFGVNKNSIIARESADIYDCISMPLSVITKMMGMDINVQIKTVKSESEEISYAVLMNNGDSLNTAFVLEIGIEYDVDSSMTILGTNGTIEVPGDWWQTGYFKMQMNSEDKDKRYSSNFEGNGFRYLIQSLLSMIEDERIMTTRILPEEQLTVVKTLKTIEKQI